MSSLKKWLGSAHPADNGVTKGMPVVGNGWYIPEDSLITPMILTGRSNFQIFAAASSSKKRSCPGAQDVTSMHAIKIARVTGVVS